MSAKLPINLLEGAKTTTNNAKEHNKLRKTYIYIWLSIAWRRLLHIINTLGHQLFLSFCLHTWNKEQNSKKEKNSDPKCWFSYFLLPSYPNGTVQSNCRNSAQSVYTIIMECFWWYIREMYTFVRTFYYRPLCLLLLSLSPKLHTYYMSEVHIHLHYTVTGIMLLFPYKNKYTTK